MEQLLLSLKVMALGLGTVFLTLIALIGVIELINIILNKKDDKVDNDEELEEVTVVSKIEDPEEDTEELIAVIAAAVAASLNRSTHDIVVRSIKRAPNTTPQWRNEGRRQQILGKF